MEEAEARHADIVLTGKYDIDPFQNEPSIRLLHQSRALIMSRLVSMTRYC